MQIQCVVDNLGVGQGAIGGQADHGARRTEGVEGADEAAQHIVQRAAEHRHAGGAQAVGQHVVAGLVGSGDHDLPQALAALQAFDLTQDHRRAGHLGKHLARQPRGRHAGLKYGERQGEIPTRCAT